MSRLCNLPSIAPLRAAEYARSGWIVVCPPYRRSKRLANTGRGFFRARASMHGLIPSL